MDFQIQNHITVRYSENGKCILDHQQQELVAATDMEIIPHFFSKFHINTRENPSCYTGE